MSDHDESAKDKAKVAKRKVREKPWWMLAVFFAIVVVIICISFIINAVNGPDPPRTPETELHDASEDDVIPKSDDNLVL